MRVSALIPSTFFASATVALIAATLFVTSADPLASARHRVCAVPRRSDSGSPGYGTVRFANSCTAAVQPALQQEIAKLHSFEATIQGFEKIGVRDHRCAIAHWGAAMSARGNPLGGSLDERSLQAGRKLVDRALVIKSMTPRERGLIEAMDVYYRPYNDHIARARAYAERMDALHAAYPDDADIAALDGLALIEGVDLNDKTYARQKRAGPILEAVMQAYPGHPGAPHYLIHAYDYTALATRAVHAAEIYPTIATNSSHAQHMPAHIWSMLGRWDRSIDANRKSSYVTDPSSGHDEIKGDIVFEHAFDFIAYARLQKAEDRHVAEDLAAAKTPPLIVAARYALELGDWAGATQVRVPKDDAFDAALARFTRAYGAARAGDVQNAKSELAALESLRGPVAKGAGEYWGVFVDIYVEVARAWQLKADGKREEALALMRKAAQRDDGHEKHIYLENKILPMRESLADMEREFGRYREAVKDYEASLVLAPNRYRSFLGAAQAANGAGDRSAARKWSQMLLDLAKDGDHTRPGDAAAKSYLSAGN